MKLKLKNFRCYLEKEFDFGSEGLLLLSGPSGVGKCLGKDTPVLFYNGNIKKVQEIKIGDILMGDNSSPREVLSTTTGKGQMYKITPKIGRPYIVNDKHILTLKGSSPEIIDSYTVTYIEKGRKISKNFNDKNDAEFFFNTLPKNPIYDISIEEYLKLSQKDKEHNYTFHSSVDFPKFSEPIVDPYLVGINLAQYKFLPNYYKYGSKKVRSKLLSGLVQYRGIIDNDTIKIINLSPRLVQDIEFVCFSLGYMVTSEKSVITIYKNSFETMQKINIEPIGIGEYYGFQLDGNGRFLLGDFTVTHNSSIMMAITFALYGTGNKLVTFGKTSCEVRLEFNNLVITRTKKPNRLVVLNTNSEDDFEDDAAQSIINEKFGTAFEVTSYVKQNALNSFITMSPLEKLEFLEKFAFQGVDLGQIKGRCQAAIKKRNEELISTTSQLELANGHFKTLVKPNKISFPIKTNNQENTIKNESIRLKNCRILIKRAEKDLQRSTEEYTETKIFISNMNNKKENLNSIKDKIITNENEKNTIYYEGDEKLNIYEENLKFILSRKELEILKNKYEEDKTRLEIMEENEIREYKRDIESIENNLWKEYTSSSANKLLIEYQHLVKDAEKLSVLKNSQERYKIDTEKLKKNRELLLIEKEELLEKRELLAKLVLQKELYECPSCHVSLKFQDNKLRYAGDKADIEDIEEETSIEQVKSEISDLIKSIKLLEDIISENENKLKRYNEVVEEIGIIEEQYEEELPDIKEIESTIEYLKEYKKTQSELEKKRKKLEGNIREKNFSSSFELFKEQINKMKEKIKSTESSFKGKKNIDYDIKHNEEELRNKIQIQRQNKSKIENLDNQIKLLNSELSIITEQINKIETEFKFKFELRGKDIIQNEIKNKNKEIDDLKNKVELHEKNVAKIDEYKKYKEELDRYIEWNNKVEVLSAEEDKNRRRYAASTLLKDKILEAESLSIMNIINSINIHAQEYLDLFFPVDPIVVRLLPFKQTKKKTSKPQINLEIDYKGMEADVTMLSGGELARVILAYTLSLAEIFGSPIIMLDESVASLDQEMSSTVMDGIRKNFGNRLVIVVGHQVLTADFDREITL